MKLSEIFRSITSILAKPLSNLKYKTISIDNVNAQLEDLKWDLTIVDDTYNQLTDKQLTEMYSRVLNRIKSDPMIIKALGVQVTDFITSIDKHLSGRARSFGFLKSLKFTNKAIMNLVDDLQDNVGMVFANNDGVVVGDTQVSHGLFFGAMELANTYSKFNSYLIAVFSHIISMTQSTTDAMPKYMAEYLVKNGSMYIELLNTVTNSPNGVPILNTIINIKKKGTDFKLADSSTVQQHLVAMPIIAATALTAFVLGMFNISMFGEAYVSIRHSIYEWEKNRKKWLENHVANIRLNLENVDINDPEYVKTLKIIIYYDDKIAEMDKSIQAYYNSK